MNLLILSSNNGGGHNSVAAALREAFEAAGHTCEVADTLSFLSPGCSRVVSQFHSGVYRHAPDLFRAGYRHTEQHRQMFQPGHRARRFLDLGIKRLAERIQNGRFDAVLCSHVFAANMLTDAVQKYDLHVKTGVVETDYTNTPGVEASVLDYYFVPSPRLALSLEKLGVPEEKILPTGIPVRAQIRIHHDRTSAKLALGLDPVRRHLLVMCGSMGCGPIPELLAALCTKKDADTDITVVCSTNEKLKAELLETYGDQPDIQIFGHVDNVSLLLDSADVYLTKPGGISITEAAWKRVPLVLINTVGGCESYNLHYFLCAGAAWTGETTDQLADAAVCLCRSAPLRQKVSAGLDAIASSIHIEQIVAAVAGDASFAPSR